MEGKVHCSFLCSPQSRMWAEMQPRGHQINQVARGNSTSCLETDPLISLHPPLHLTKCSPFLCSFFSIIFIFPSQPVSSNRLPPPQPLHQSGGRLLDLWGRSSLATMRHLLASVVRTWIHGYSWGGKELRWKKKWGRLEGGKSQSRALSNARHCTVDKGIKRILQNYSLLSLFIVFVTSQSVSLQKSRAWIPPTINSGKGKLPFNRKNPRAGSFSHGGALLVWLVR